FPIAVHLSKPSHVDALKSVGVNTYLEVEHDGSPISTITSKGVNVIAQGEWTRAEIGDDPRVVAWTAGDECDMGYCGGSNEREGLDLFSSHVNQLRSYNDGRFVFANFGNGVLRTYWMPTLMGNMVQLTDAASVDKYAYTSPHVQDIIPGSPRWPGGATPKSAGAYGWLADQLRSFWSSSQPHPSWVFIESAMPLLSEDGATTITPEQIEGAAWSAIIHEARGLAYFQHNNGPACSFYSLVDCSQTRLDRIRAINAAIQSLAPVINTQSYQYNFANGTDTMLKTYSGSAYIFADIGLQQSPGTKTFRLPAGITGTTVTVVGENRTIPVVNGSFSDGFAAEYTHHVYKVTL
ncbi:MAG TPA: hypothetical protein VHM89_01880, partial [Acidimicrobiales bacterium]|nr:hypothetical protein [Acidimicrobiales bacterium]